MAVGGDANAPAIPSKKQRCDAGEGEKKKSQRLRESSQLLCCRRIRITLTKAQAGFLRRAQGGHRYIYNRCVNMENNGEIHSTDG